MHYLLFDKNTPLFYVIFIRDNNLKVSNKYQAFWSTYKLKKMSQSLKLNIFYIVDELLLNYKYLFINYT